MEKATAKALVDVIQFLNVSAGHAGEMSGRAIRAAGESVGCPVMDEAGKMIAAAGKAWANAALDICPRDVERLGS